MCFVIKYQQHFYDEENLNVFIKCTQTLDQYKLFAKTSGILKQPHLFIWIFFSKVQPQGVT